MSEAGPLIPPWTRLPCAACGVAGLATRAEARPGPYVCSGCDDCGDTDALVAEVHRLRAQVELNRLTAIELDALHAADLTRAQTAEAEAGRLRLLVVVAAYLLDGNTVESGAYFRLARRVIDASGYRLPDGSIASELLGTALGLGDREDR